MTAGTEPRSAQRPAVAAPRPTRIALDDGAVGFLVENHDLPLVDISISLRTGSAFDPAEKVGLTRAFSRMLRRGAAGLTSEDIEAAIDRLGGELAIEASPSSVNIHLQVIRRNLEPFVKLLAGVLTQPTFPADELARLQRETVAEIVESRDHDRSLVTRFFRRKLFGAHPYGRGSTGTSATVGAISRDDVVAVHETQMRRANLVLGVAGDLTADDVQHCVAPLVRAFPGGPVVRDATRDPIMQPNRRLVFVDKPARTQTQILIGTLGTHVSDSDHVALHVANTVFGGTFTARLMKEVRSKRGWSYGASSRLPIERRREAFSMWTFPAATDAAACVQLEIELLEALVSQGITDEELAFAQNFLSESYAFDIDTPYKRVRQAVDEELYALPSDYHTGYIDHVRAVTRDEANAALKRRISVDNLLVAVVGTAADIKEPIEGAIPRLASAEVVAFDAD